MTSEDRYKVALNIVARVGIDGNVLGEYAKAMAGLNSFESMQDMPPPPPMNAMQGMEQPMPQEGMEQPMEQGAPQAGKYDDL